MNFKIVSLVLACVLVLAAGFAYATPPGHEEPNGQGHERYQGNGFGHVKHDVSPS